MNSVTLGVRLDGPGFRRHRLPAVDFTAKVTLLKEEAARETGVPVEALELIYHGRVLDDEKSLLDHGVKADETIYVLKKNIQNSPEPKKNYTEIELYEFLLFFKTFKLPSENDIALLLQIRDYGHNEKFISSVPALANDPVAVNYLREPELLAHMSDIEVIRNLVDKHPGFLEVIKKVTESKEFKQTADNCNRLFHAPDFDDVEEVDVAENDEDIYGMPRDGQQGQIITPEQLSSALAFAGMTAGTNNSSAPSANSSMTDGAPSGFNGFREFLGSLLAADRPSSSPGPSRSLITTDMISNALSRAISQGSPSSSTRESSASTSEATTTDDAANLRLYADQLAKMQEMGLTDNNINLRALIINNGDVNAAINLVLTYIS